MKPPPRLKRGNCCVFRNASNPCWSMKLSFPGHPAKTRSSQYPLCDDCASTPSPQRARPRCACRAPAEKLAAEWLKAEQEEAERALRNLPRLSDPAEQLRLRRHHDFPTWGQVFDTYLATVSPSIKARGTAAENVRTATLILSEALGISRSAARTVRCDQPSPAQVRQWQRQRQHKGTDAAELPALETHRPLPANTTINSMLNKAASILSKENRQHLFSAFTLPEHNPFTALHLPTLVGNPGRSAEAKYAMHAEAQTWPALTAHSPDWITYWSIPKGRHTVTPPADIGTESWLAYWLLLVTGIRPVELRAATRAWIVRDAGEWFLDVMNRPDEGFTLKAGTMGKAKRLPLAELPADALDILLSRTGLLIAPDWTKTQRHALTERFMSKHFAKHLPGVHAPVYELRKWFLSAQYRQHGLDAAALAAGHSTTKTTATHYTAAKPSAPVRITELLQGDGMATDKAVPTEGGEK